MDAVEYLKNLDKDIANSELCKEISCTDCKNEYWFAEVE